MSEEITISRRVWEELLDRELLLNCLEAAGVDCWDGYSFAIDAYEEHKENEQNG